MLEIIMQRNSYIATRVWTSCILYSSIEDRDKNKNKDRDKDRDKDNKDKDKDNVA